MNKPFYDDKAYIAGQFKYQDRNITEFSRLAVFKINSYKLALANAAFCMTQKELADSISSSLLNYTDSSVILSNIGYFEDDHFN